MGEGAELAEADEVFSAQCHPSLPLEGGGNPSEQKARDAVDGRSFLVGTADHLIRHLSVTPSPARKAVQFST